MSGTCRALIIGHGGFHWYRCDRPAKGQKVAAWGTARGQTVAVCGIHLRVKVVGADQ